MAKKISETQGLTALNAVRSGELGTAQATAVRYLLQCLAEKEPGHSVEVRVPPYGAVQAIEGPRHTRGTPANVIETDPATWIALATGELEWAEALATNRVIASGVRAHLEGSLPVRRFP